MQREPTNNGPQPSQSGDQVPTNEAPPEWADRWLPGTCGCGARLVVVQTMTGEETVACALTGWPQGRHKEVEHG